MLCHISIPHHHLHGINEVKLVGGAAFEMLVSVVGEVNSERIMILEGQFYIWSCRRYEYQFHRSFGHNITNITTTALRNIIKHHHLQQCTRLAVKVMALVLNVTGTQVVGSKLQRLDGKALG
ncbi:hypothetical protein [Prevotella sp.]|uniref:hypothetical protein n=1 Tax=Prevotella sp. TaxID=59823 RepID=UPI00307CC79E